MNLDTCLTRIIPLALTTDARGGEDLQRILTPAQSREIARLYGQAVGSWANYRELLRQPVPPQRAREAATETWLLTGDR